MLARFWTCLVTGGLVFTAGLVTGELDAADLIGTPLAERDPVVACIMPGSLPYQDHVAIPGTDLCVKFGGYARLASTVLDKNWIGTNDYEVRNLAVQGYSVSPDGVVPDVTFAYRDNLTEAYSQARVIFDVWTATDYGAVRGYVELQADGDTQRTGDSFALRHGYLQFGNWLFGKTWSTFSLVEAGPLYSDPYAVVGDNSFTMRRNQIRYTHPFGSGVSLALALEDQAFDSPSAAIVGFGPNAPNKDPAAKKLKVVNADNNVPDLVAALKWQRDALSVLQVSAGFTQNRFVEEQKIGGQKIQTFRDDDIGYALSLGLKHALPTGQGSYMTLIANYTDGAGQYLIDVFGSATNVVWGRCGGENCILDQVRKWSVLSSVTHRWTPTLATTIGAGYGDTDYGVSGTAWVASASPAGVRPGVLNAASFEGFVNFLWTPVKGTEFLLDVHYGRIDFGDFDLAPAVAGVQSAQGAWAGTLQVTRRF